MQVEIELNISDNSSFIQSVLKVLQTHFQSREEHSDKEIDHFNRACWNLESYIQSLSKGVEFKNYAGVDKKDDNPRPFKKFRRDY